MKQSPTKNSTRVKKIVCLYPLYLPSSFQLTPVQGTNSAAPTPPSVGVSHFRHTLPSPGHCHVLGPTEQSAFKQERQHLSVRLTCPPTSHAFARTRHHLSGGACRGSLENAKILTNPEILSKGRQKSLGCM